MDPTPLLMIALLGVAFWLLVIRPAKGKQAAQRQMINQVKVGDRVMTTAGLFGYVAELRPDEVGLEISDGVIVFMVKPAIAKVITEPVVAEPDPTAEVDVTTEDVDPSPAADSAAGK